MIQGMKRRHSIDIGEIAASRAKEKVPWYQLASCLKQEENHERPGQGWEEWTQIDDEACPDESGEWVFAIHPKPRKTLHNMDETRDYADEEHVQQEIGENQQEEASKESVVEGTRKEEPAKEEGTEANTTEKATEEAPELDKTETIDEEEIPNTAEEQPSEAAEGGGQEAESGTIADGLAAGNDSMSDEIKESAVATAGAIEVSSPQPQELQSPKPLRKRRKSLTSIIEATTHSTSNICWSQMSVM